jgi:hypothetical protein
MFNLRLFGCDKLREFSYHDTTGLSFQTQEGRTKNNEELGMRNEEFFRRRIWAHFFAVHRTAKKPGYPLQSFLRLRRKKGFPLLSRLHGRAAILL